MSQKITSATAWPERFWLQVNKGDGCWEWIGAYRNDYGVVMFNGKRRAAHRVSWQMVFGSILNSEWILHHCDNPRCVRPSHLFAGNPRDNILDCSKKGRWSNGNRKGERHPLATLSDRSAKRIREMYTGKRGEIVWLSRLYGVQRKVISRIVKNLSYQTPLGAEAEKKGESNANTGNSTSQAGTQG